MRPTRGLSPKARADFSAELAGEVQAQPTLPGGLVESRPPFLLRSTLRRLDNGLDHTDFVLRHYCAGGRGKCQWE